MSRDNILSDPNPCDPISGRKKISKSLNYIRIFIRWLGFHESPAITVLHLIFMFFLLLGALAVLLNFHIYEEFERRPDGIALFYAGTPLLFLFFSNVIFILTFSFTGKEDKLWSLLLVNDQSDGDAEDNKAQIDSFSNEVSAKILNFRVFAGSFAMIAIAFKVTVDLCRLSHHIDPIYFVCVVGVWCYLCSTFILANGFLYLAAVTCTLHLSIYKALLKKSGNNVLAYFKHHQRLRKLLKKFSAKFSWYLASQAAMAIMSMIFTMMTISDAHINRPGAFMLGAADFICWIIIEIPMFWVILLVLNNLRKEMESIFSVVDERGKICQVASVPPKLPAHWERLASPPGSPQSPPPPPPPPHPMPEFEELMASFVLSFRDGDTDEIVRFMRGMAQTMSWAAEETSDLLESVMAQNRRLRRTVRRLKRDLAKAKKDYAEVLMGPEYQ
ncbi:uncharacterized protein [Euphorbia lathyris]|uniref:uncharacterized protein n=1 Tax=Euphorbia lathyris TaxID=212925 RepID=UPI00331335BB